MKKEKLICEYSDKCTVGVKCVHYLVHDKTTGCGHFGCDQVDNAVCVSIKEIRKRKLEKLNSL